MKTPAPDWLAVLRQQCQATSQTAVAQRLRQADGYPSAAVINQALKGKYAGNIDRLRALVEGVYLGKTVVCPVVGEIARSDCEAHQRAPFAATNPLRVRLYRACRSGCPHSKLPREY